MKVTAETKNKLAAQKKFNLNDARELVAVLRGENGCPWDRAQTHKTLCKTAIEEAYELADAVEGGDKKKIVDELGDNLIQVLLHAQIGEDEGEFTMDDVCTNLCQKLISRHSFVFGEDKAATAADALGAWEKNKIKNQAFETDTAYLSSVPVGMSPLMRTVKICQRAGRAAFDFNNEKQVFDKVHEELSEVEEAAATAAKEPENAKARAHLEEEVGDLLFVCANLSRFLKIDAETALIATNKKFLRRFEYMEKALLEKEGLRIENASFELREKYWQEAKKFD